MQAAVIENGVVVNVIVTDSLDIIPGLVDGSGAAIGDAWDGQSFIKPSPLVPSVPARVTMLNAQLVMIDEGWFTDVQAFIASIPGADGYKARAYFDHALSIERAHPLVLGYQQARGKTDAQMDDLFMKAGALNA